MMFIAVALLLGSLKPITKKKYIRNIAINKYLSSYL